MQPVYLYVAQCKSDSRFKKHHIYKVGQSTMPLDRIRALGGSGSTETYEPLCILELPTYVKDIHVLVHRAIHPFVVCRHAALRTKYLSIFGTGHTDGLRRRRELVMFGETFSSTRVKSIFKRAVSSLQSKNGEYNCSNVTCASNSGSAYCAVCVTFTRSLINGLKYQSLRSALGRRAVVARLARLLSTNNKTPWRGPSVGSFWALTSTVRKTDIQIIQVQTVDKRRRTSAVVVWTPSSVDGDVSRMLNSRFICPDEHASASLPWDSGQWSCCVDMLQFSHFGRIRNIVDVTHATQH